MTEPSGELLPAAGPSADYVERRFRQARAAVEARQGVTLFVIVQEIRDDGYPGLAEDIVRDLVVRALTAARTDPELFSHLLAMVVESEQRAASVGAGLPARPTAH